MEQTNDNDKQMNKEHKDPDVIDLDAPRFAWYKQKVWKKRQNTVYWVDIHELEQQGPRQQRAGNLRNAVRRICVKIECR